MSGDEDESNDITVEFAEPVTSGFPVRVRDGAADINFREPSNVCEPKGDREIESQQPLEELSIDGKDSDDVITLRGPAAKVRGGDGRDQIRLDEDRLGNGPYLVSDAEVDLEDGDPDRVFCEAGQAVRVDVESSDPQDRFIDNCNVRERDEDDDDDNDRDDDDGDDDEGADAPPAFDLTAPLADLYTRRIYRRGTVLRGGLRATCSSAEVSTCAVTGSISRSAARALGIRTRARRYVITRGSTPVSAPGASTVQTRLSGRARSALRGRRVRGLRVLLTGTVRDRAGNLSTTRFTVTVRG